MKYGNLHFGLAHPVKVATIVIGMLIGETVAAQDFDRGVESYLEGDYQSALHEFQVLAENGDAGAQHLLGQMFRRGAGVPQDFSEAMKLWKLSADQGYVEAQYTLGVMYYYGAYGVPEDHVQALAWLNLTVAQGVEDARPLWHSLHAQLSPEQVAEAQELSLQWQVDSDQHDTN